MAVALKMYPADAAQTHRPRAFPPPVEPRVSEQGGDYDDGLLGVAVPIMMACYVVATLSVVLAFRGSGEALFAIVLCVVYGAMFFGVPAVMMRIRSSHDRRWRSTRTERNSDMVSVLTGPMTRFEAVLQMVIVPLAVAVLFASFAFIWLVVRP
jgi:hypothetical protein